MSAHAYDPGPDERCATCGKLREAAVEHYADVPPLTGRPRLTGGMLDKIIAARSQPRKRRHRRWGYEERRRALTQRQHHPCVDLHAHHDSE
jgi:hypothetical protein